MLTTQPQLKPDTGMSTRTSAGFGPAGLDHVTHKGLLIVGLGNSILGDDGVGIKVAQYLDSLLTTQKLAELQYPIEITEDYRGGLHLMERLVGYRDVILIDAMCTQAHIPGTIIQIEPGSLDTQHCSSAHDASLMTAIDMGRRCGAVLPSDDRLVLIGIEAVNVLDFSETCTPEVEAAIPIAADLIMTILEQWRVAL